MGRDKDYVTAIGSQADQILKERQYASVAGTSRRGIFLQAFWTPTLYISREPFRGPLTINASVDPGPFNALHEGERASLDQYSIYFPDSEYQIEIKNPLVWKPGPSPKCRALSADHIQDFVNQAKALQPDNPYLPLLDLSAFNTADSEQGFAGIGEHILPIREALAGDYPLGAFVQFQKILGAGPGLTPLGDDYLMGILLAAHRTNRHLHWPSHERFSALLTSAAMSRTTQVSWSLLVCALAGEADERIIRVLDGLIAGREIPENDLYNLLTWGSSSGVAVLAGMLLVLSLQGPGPL